VRSRGDKSQRCCSMQCVTKCMGALEWGNSEEQTRRRRDKRHNESTLLRHFACTQLLRDPSHKDAWTLRSGTHTRHNAGPLALPLSSQSSSLLQLPTSSPLVTELRDDEAASVMTSSPASHIQPVRSAAELSLARRVRRAHNLMLPGLLTRRRARRRQRVLDHQVHHH
jgi:hypothetical protein